MENNEIKRGRGRPKGSKNKTTAQYRAEREPKRLPWRPTLYTDDMPERAYSYFMAEILPTVELAGMTVTRWPTVAGFGELVGVSDRTVKLWAQQYPEFAEALRIGEARVAEMRELAGETRIVDPAFEKFILSSKYGLKENTSVTIGQDQEKPFQVKIEIV